MMSNLIPGTSIPRRRHEPTLDRVDRARFGGEPLPWWDADAHMEMRRRDAAEAGRIHGVPAEQFMPAADDD